MVPKINIVSRTAATKKWFTMMVVTRGLLVSVFLLLLSSTRVAHASSFEDTSSDSATKVVVSSCEYVLEDGLLVRYQTLQDDPLIHWELRYERSDVWMGLGFAPNGTMVGSTVVIGFPSSSNEEQDEIVSSSAGVYYLAARSTQGVAPLPEGANTTTTAIQFVITEDIDNVISEENNTTASDSPTVDAPTVVPTVSPTGGPTATQSTSSPSLGSTITPPPVVEEPAKTTLPPTGGAPVVVPVNHHPPPTAAPTKRTYQQPVAAPSFFDEWFRQLEEIDLRRHHHHHHRVLHTQHHRLLELDLSDTTNLTQSQSSSLQFQSSPDWHLEHDLIYAIGNGPLLGYHSKRGLIHRSLLHLGKNNETNCIFHHDDNDETSSPPTAMPSTSTPRSSSPPTFTSTTITITTITITTNVDRLNQVVEEEEEETTTKGMNGPSSSSSSTWPRMCWLLLHVGTLSIWILLASSINSI